MSLTAVLLIVFCILCYTGQSFFNKMYSINYSGPAAAATPVFAAIYGVLVGVITYAYNGFQFNPGTATLLFGIGNGIILFLFNLSAINSARTGPYAFQSLMMLFGHILLSLIFAVLFWGDKLSTVKIIGIAVMLLSFVIFNLKGLKFEGVKKGYFFWVLLLFTTNGIYGILVDAQQRVAMQNQRNEMIITTFTVSAIISIIYLIIIEGKKSPKAFKMGKKPLLFAMGSSICAAAAINLLMLTLTYVPSSILYTVENGGILIMSALLSAVVLKEKISKCMIAGIAVAVVSLVLLSV